MARLCRSVSTSRKVLQPRGACLIPPLNPTLCHLRMRKPLTKSHSLPYVQHTPAPNPPSSLLVLLPPHTRPPRRRPNHQITPSKQPRMHITPAPARRLRRHLCSISASTTPLHTPICAYNKA